MVTEITAEQLADRQDAGEQYLLLDTRPEESFESWHVEGAKNFPFSSDGSLSESDVESVHSMIDGHDEILTICAKGISSFHFAEELRDHGFDDVTVVKGGMEDWSQVYEHVLVDTPGDANVVQVQRRAKGCLGYVVGSDGEAVVVDATRHVLDTHVHADHISGGRKLADELGVPYHLGDRATERDVEYEYEPLGRNEVLTVGDAEIK